MLLDLVENITLLITLCWLHGMIMRYLDESERLGKVFAGLLFGAVCIVGMEIPLVLTEGIIFDGRTAVLSMASFFGGPLVGAIAGSMAGLFRLWIGGIGVTPGLLNILVPVLMGLGFRHIHRRGWVPFNAVTLLIFSIVLQGFQVLNLALLPAEHFALFLEHALVPLITVLIPATLLLGLMLKDTRQQALARENLRQNEAYLRAIIEAVPDLSLVLDEDGCCR